MLNQPNIFKQYKNLEQNVHGNFNNTPLSNTAFR